MIATTRGALYRGTTEDEYGDEIDNNATPVEGFEDFPVSIIETDANVFDQASSTWRTVTKLTGRVSTRIPIDDGDRIKDLRDGAIYTVDDFTSTPRGISGRSSVSMKLRRTAP